MNGVRSDQHQQCFLIFLCYRHFDCFAHPSGSLLVRAWCVSFFGRLPTSPWRPEQRTEGVVLRYSCCFLLVSANEPLSVTLTGIDSQVSSIAWQITQQREVRKRETAWIERLLCQGSLARL
jgi:hypothetical protein